MLKSRHIIVRKLIDVSFLLLLLLGTTCQAKEHKHKGRHTFAIKFSGLLPVKSDNDIQHWTRDNEITEKFLNVKNIPGHQLGLEYQYINKKNYSYTLGLSYGIQQFDYLWNINYIRFDVAHNAGLVGMEHGFQAKARYAALSFMIGRNYYPFKNKRFGVQAKIGLSFMRPIDQLHEGLYHFGVYRIDDSLFVKQYATTHIDNQGSPFYYTFYLGSCYATKTGFIKNYTFGISFIHAFALFIRDEDYTGDVYGQYYNADGKMVASDEYYDRFRNIALTVGVGF